MKLEGQKSIRFFLAGGLVLLSGCKVGETFEANASPLVPSSTPTITLEPTFVSTLLRPGPTSTHEPFDTQTPELGGVHIALPSRIGSGYEIFSELGEELGPEEVNRLYGPEGNLLDFGYYGEVRPYLQDGPDSPWYDLAHIFVSGYSRGIIQEETNGSYWVVLEIPLGNERQIMLANIPNQTDIISNLETIPFSRNIGESRLVAYSWADLANALAKPEATGNQLVWGFQIDPGNDAARSFAQAMRAGRAIDLSFDTIVGTSYVWIDGSLFGR